jgi:hypothetical protein
MSLGAYLGEQMLGAAATPKIHVDPSTGYFTDENGQRLDPNFFQRAFSPTANQDYQANNAIDQSRARMAGDEAAKYKLAQTQYGRLPIGLSPSGSSDTDAAASMVGGYPSLQTDTTAYKGMQTGVPASDVAAHIASNDASTKTNQNVSNEQENEALMGDPYKRASAVNLGLNNDITQQQSLSQRLPWMNESSLDQAKIDAGLSGTSLGYLPTQQATLGNNLVKQWDASGHEPASEYPYDMSVYQGGITAEHDPRFVSHYKQVAAGFQVPNDPQQSGQVLNTPVGAIHYNPPVHIDSPNAVQPQPQQQQPVSSGAGGSWDSNGVAPTNSTMTRQPLSSDTIDDLINSGVLSSSDLYVGKGKQAHMKSDNEIRQMATTGLQQKIATNKPGRGGNPYRKLLSDIQ